MIDENLFYRQATLRICGSLEIEETLCRTVEYLNQFIPVDRICLQVYEPELMAIRTVATATEQSLDQVDFLFPLPDQLRKEILAHGIQPEQETVIIESVADNPLAAEMLRLHGIAHASILRMNLLTRAGRLGGVILTARDENCHTAEHARLFGLLEDPFTMALANILSHRQVLRLKELLADDNRFLSQELRQSAGEKIVGADYGLKGVMEQVRQVAPTESPVLLLGETGVGKDIIANAIHCSSPRREGPFISVNCGAIPESLLDSELFGHEQGAFTGALLKKRGRFERAHQGTLFLDEIGEMPQSAQIRLLRVLQHRDFERVGGTERIAVDIRIIAATNKDLFKEVNARRFREDLWFRINVFPIVVPPLRKRSSDIPALVQHFVDRKTKQLNISPPSLVDGAIDQLMAYHWPGNVRELENVVERALILHRGEPLRFDGLVVAPSLGTAQTSTVAVRPTLVLDRVIARHIATVLEMTGGKIHGPGGAGELLGMNPNTLRYKMKKLNIPFRKDKRSLLG